MKNMSRNIDITSKQSAAEEQMLPIHHYGATKTVVGRVRDDIKIYSRRDGGCQLVFSLVVPQASASRDSYRMGLELYLEPGLNADAAQKLLGSGKLLEIDYCPRYDEYLDRFGIPTARSFLFVNGLECVRQLEPQNGAA